MIPIQTPAGTFKAWTKTIGSNEKIKVLLLHGGPGTTHEYVECFEDFFPKENIEFIDYDQLGSAYSEPVTDESLWDIDRYVEEVEQVRKALDLNSSDFYLYGQSWGGVLAMQYALKYQKNLKGLIISNALSSAKAYQSYLDAVITKQVDPAVLKEALALEAAGDVGNPRYSELMFPSYYNKFICRVPSEQWPEPMYHSNRKLASLMQGPSEFAIHGKMEAWEISDQLKEIDVPSLFIGAKYDTMDPEYMRWMSAQVKNGEFLYCPTGSHVSVYDDQDIYRKGIISFLKKDR